MMYNQKASFIKMKDDIAQWFKPTIEQNKFQVFQS